MFVASKLGLAPWDVFHQGIYRKTGIPLGIVIELIGVMLLAITWLALRVRPGLGTILNVIVIGLVVFLIVDHLPTSPHLVWRLAYLFGGVLSIGLGSGLYIGAGLGPGPRDSLMLGLAEHGVSVRLARTMVEAVVLAAGLLLGGSAGIGTVVFTLGIGPTVQFFMPRLRIAGDAAAVAAAH